MITQLADLDELILKCRDDRAKEYISEAIASYRVGAYRSAIVSTWVAICFDVIEKIKELALSGDKEAENIVIELEKTRKENDLSKALKFERELLSVAKDKFELLSPLELIDLERLQEDRNRCAHPSLLSEGQIYSPSAELARVHIRSAVMHLLQHPPVQGKYALDRLMNEFTSEYFPDDKDKAKISLLSGPLRRARESLVRNTVLVLIKKLLKEKNDWNQFRRFSAALNAVFELYPNWCNITFSEKLSPILRSLDDKELNRTLQFFKTIANSWQYVDTDIIQRIEIFVLNLPSDLFDEIEFLLSFNPLKENAKIRTNRANYSELTGALFFIAPTEIIDQTIKFYLKSKNYDEANELGKKLSTYAFEINSNQIKQIITNVAVNEQIRYSFELGPLLAELRKQNTIPEKEFDNLLNSSDLSKFAPTVPQKSRK
jgi:hypothetical protein